MQSYIQPLFWLIRLLYHKVWRLAVYFLMGSLLVWNLHLFTQFVTVWRLAVYSFYPICNYMFVSDVFPTNDPLSDFRHFIHEFRYCWLFESWLKLVVNLIHFQTTWWEAVISKFERLFDWFGNRFLTATLLTYSGYMRCCCGLSYSAISL